MEIANVTIPRMPLLINSGEVRTRISTINASLDGTAVTLRARVHNLRLQGILALSFHQTVLTSLGSKMIFFELRQQTDTVQALLVQSKEISKQMLKFAGSITSESIILVRGTVKQSPIEINATTIKDAEVHIAEVQPANNRVLTCRSGSFQHLLPDFRCS